MIVDYVYKTVQKQYCGPYQCDSSDFQNFFKKKPAGTVFIRVATATEYCDWIRGTGWTRKHSGKQNLKKFLQRLKLVDIVSNTIS